MISKHGILHRAEGNIIYNSTLYDIWLNYDKNNIKIKSGETVKL